jgi:hypothetical protein
MPATFGTTVAQEYTAKVLKVFFARSIFDDITNKDYFTPGDSNPRTTKNIKSRFQKFNIPTLYSNGWSTFSGSDLSFTAITESIATLTIDQFKALADLIPDLSVFKSQVKDPNSTIIQQAGDKLKKLMDQYATSFWSDVASGHWLGTNYTTGTVAVTTGTGAVTGTGTTFTAAMVGKPFKATGHSAWYRVKTYTSATSIVIEDDSDDETSAYTGGTISAGATYVIQANTALATTKTEIAGRLLTLSQMLDDAEVPQNDRWCILPADAKSALLTAAEFNRDIEVVYKETVQNGKIGKAYGMDLYVLPSANVAGDNTDGYKVMAGHKSFLTAGYGFISPIEVVNPENNFGSKIKGLFAYGAKVADERRKAAAMLLATFS